MDQELGYVMDMPNRRLTFNSGSDIYAMKFGNEEQFRWVGEYFKSTLGVLPLL